MYGPLGYLGSQLATKLNLFNSLANAYIKRPGLVGTGAAYGTYGLLSPFIQDAAATKNSSLVDSIPTTKTLQDQDSIEKQAAVMQELTDMYRSSPPEDFQTTPVVSQEPVKSSNPVPDAVSDKLVPNDLDNLNDLVTRVIRGDFGNNGRVGNERLLAMQKELGDQFTEEQYKTVQKAVNEKLRVDKQNQAKAKAKKTAKAREEQASKTSQSMPIPTITTPNSYDAGLMHDPESGFVYDYYGNIVGMQ